MAKKLIITVGLPRSGKSTWAKSYGCPVVNPDSIRLALHGQAFIKSAEPIVWATAHLMARALLNAGHHEIIIDATNVHRRARSEWANKFNDCEIGYKVFTTSKEECIERAKLTGQEYLIPVIERMAKDWDYETTPREFLW